MSRESLAGGVPVSLEPLQTTEAHAYWRTFVSGRTDLPTSDLQIHLDRYLALPPEEQRSHFSVKKEGRIVGTVRLGPAEISGFSGLSVDPAPRGGPPAALLRSMNLLRAGGASSIIAHFGDFYKPAFGSPGFRGLFPRMRRKAPTKRTPAPINVKLHPQEEDEA